MAPPADILPCGEKRKKGKKGGKEKRKGGEKSMSPPLPLQHLTLMKEGEKGKGERRWPSSLHNSFGGKKERKKEGKGNSRPWGKKRKHHWTLNTIYPIFITKKEVAFYFHYM